ncbi:MAG: MFS transporter [Chloroflexi bacterium]|nr:MFS transporter [Chloroflexota bacterium]
MTRPGQTERCAIRLAQWQRNLIGVLIAAFVSILGFNLTFPFLPLYIQQLGVSDAGRAAFWAGVIGSVAGVLSAVVAPLWGGLADRRGRRPMLVRATAGSAVGLVVMGLAPGLLVLLAGRIAFGLMAGTVPAANPLIAANTPPEYVSGAMGALQSSVYVSNAVGPLVGGVLASTVGYRVTFLITAGLYIASALPVLLLVRETFTPPERVTPLLPGMAANFRFVFARGEIVQPMVAAFLAYAGVSMMQPVLPLHIRDLIGEGSVERATGVAVGLQGLASTVTALLIGRVTRRIGFAPLLYVGPPLLGAAYVALWAADRFLVFVVALVALGAVQGLVVTALTSLVALRAPRERAGAVFGVVTSVNSFAFSGAPFFGGFAASAFGLRAVFPISAALMVAMMAVCVQAIGRGVPTRLGPRARGTTDRGGRSP